MNHDVLTAFLRYVSFDTKSDETTGTTPSTKKQLLLGAHLAEALKAMSMDSVIFDEYGYVYAILEATEGREKDTPMGLIAHMDTSPDAAGKDIEACIVENYDGKDILLNAEKQIFLSPREYPSLKKYQGQSLVVTDGTTLLGADDKAGIAEIITALKEVIGDKEPHGTICIAFTPDEEIGEGTGHFNLAAFPAKYAYTIDGGELGELEYECFNAASATVDFYGVNIHPGEAKDKMRNASLLAMEFHSMLPEKETPFYTQDYEGFYHLTNMEGTVEKAKIHYLIRDHDKASFARRKKRLSEITCLLQEKYGEASLVLTIEDRYYNMKEKIVSHPQMIEKAKRAMEDNGITPLVRPIRGGTDGACLSFMGIPTPNLSTGGHNFHGRFEFVPVASMEKMVDVIKTLIKGENICF